MPEEEPKRDAWGNYCEFFLSSLGLAVGLGNVWRFPYVCYENGGGSFLIPYLIMLVFVGAPAFFMEQSLGQYGQVGANKAFDRFAPIMRGTGYAMLTVRFMVNFYYVIVMAWAIFYIAAGFQKNLPWESCLEDNTALSINSSSLMPDWHSLDCYSKESNVICHEKYGINYTFYNGSCTTNTDYCLAHGVNDSTCNDEVVANIIKDDSIYPSEDYLNGFMLGYIIPGSGGEKYSWDNYGTMSWELTLCLLLSWIMICLSMIGGLQSFGKVAYVVTLSPYVVLTALLAYCATLPGAKDGILYFLTPEWEALADFNVWAKGASQILFSLSLGFGSQMNLSTYNNFKNNTQRDAVIISICNSLTSIYAGFVVFSILGFMKDQTGADNWDDVVKGGIGLAFISYPAAVLQMDVSPLWSFLFFFMLVNLAMSSLCGGFQTFLGFVMDEWPNLRPHRIKLTIGFSVLYFLLGLSMCTDGGILLFTVFDNRCTASTMLMIFLEVVALAWIYGADNFIDRIEEMGMTWQMQRKTGVLRWFWKIMWMFVTPVILAVITILSWIDHEPLSYEDYVFPQGVEIFAWFVELGPLIFVFAIPIYDIIKMKSKGNDWNEIKNALLKPPATKDEKSGHDNVACF